MKDEILYWIWLSECCGVASKDLPRLCERFDDPFEIYRMEEEEIERIEGISRGTKQRRKAFYSNMRRDKRSP